MAVRIMIAEDHEVTRLGILSMLNDLPVEVVAQTSTGQETLDRSSALAPEVLLLDIRFPDMDGFAILKHFRQTGQSIRVAIVSTYENPTYVARSIIWGAIDYLPKGMPELDFPLHSPASSMPSPPTPMAYSVASRKYLVANGIEDHSRAPRSPTVNTSCCVIWHLA